MKRTRLLTAICILGPLLVAPTPGQGAAPGIGMRPLSLVAQRPSFPERSGHGPSPSSAIEFGRPHAGAAQPAAQAPGCTLYVSTSGSDSQDGRTEASAFRTIQRAADSVQPGDVVCVRAGTYAGFTVSRSGMQAQPIMFRTLPGEQVTVTGGAYIDNAAFNTLDGFTFVDGGTPNGAGIELMGSNAGYNSILNCQVTRSAGFGIGIWGGAHHNLIKRCRVYDNVTGNWPRGTATLNGHSWGAALVISSRPTNQPPFPVGNIVEDSYFYWNHGEGPTIGADAMDTVFRRNVIADNWGANVYVAAPGATVEDNLIYTTDDAKTHPACVDRCWNRNADGIDISIEYNEGAVPKDLDIRNNIIVNTGRGLQAFINDASYTTSGWLVTNNTFLGNDDGIYVAPPIMQSAFRNNLIVQNRGGYTFAIVEPAGGNLFSNNLYFGASQRFRWGPADYEVSGWQQQTGDASSEWTDPRIVNAAAVPPRLWNDPSLPNVPDTPPSRDELAAPYRLTSVSPAIDAGTAQDAPSSDFEGNPRPQGAGYDIGAYEFLLGDPTSFTDVPSSHWAYADIERLYQGGYVVGCQATPVRKYCPEQGLTRAEAAVFVVRGVRGSGFAPPQPTQSAFADVPLSHWGVEWIEQLWQDGFTSGCATGPLRFCSEAPHTRAEATVFFLRMLRGKDYLPPEPTSSPYTDVALGTWYSKWVAAAHADGLVQDCEAPEQRGDDRFRPGAPLTRAEAACMMAKAKALP